MLTKLVKMISFSLFIFINCCNQDNNPSAPITNPEDLALKQKLIGGWEFAGHSIFFNEDGTYFDSIFTNPYPLFEGGFDSLNVCTDIKRGVLFLNMVTKGIYKIENGILRKQPIDYIIDCNPLKAPACYLYFEQYMECLNDTLKLTQYYIWQRIDNRINDIWGRWKRNYWAWSYHKNLPSKGAPQLITETVTFFIDSSYYHQKLEGLPYEGILSRRSFEYAFPLLKGTDDYTFFIVSFKSNEMHWYRQNSTWNYLRIK